MHVNSKRVTLKILKVVAWVVFAFILFAVGITMTLLSMLSPDRLTPIANNVANKVLNADVEIGKIGLSGSRLSQYIYIDIDELSICSRDIKKLPKSVRDTIPVWGDTLAALKHFHGGINIAKLFTGVVELRDIALTHPRINILVVNEAQNNFSIIPPSTDSDTSAVSLPDIRINRLEIIDPAPIRFADLPQKFDMTANIITMSLANESTPKGYFPAYNIDFACNVHSPAFNVVDGNDNVPVSLKGIVEWHYERPYALVMKDMDFALLMLSGRLNTNIDFSDLMTVETFDLRFNPIRVNDLLLLFQESIARHYDLPYQLDTDAQIQLSAILHQPYTVGQIPMPLATAKIEIPECSLQYEKVDLSRFAADVDVEFRGGSPDQVLVDVNHLTAQGPASDFTVKGSLSSLMSDPRFEGEMKGNIDISHIPTILTSRIGAVLGGDVSLDASMEWSSSMFSREKFHNIKLDGSLEGNNIYYLKYDTLSMVSVPRIKGHFGNNSNLGAKKNSLLDRFLRGSVEVDSADILVSGLDIRLGQLQLGISAKNEGASSVDNSIVPMGGGISAASFSLFTISDTAGVKVKNLEGSIDMQRYKDYAHFPTFKLNLHLDRLSTGNNSTRFVVGNGDLKFNIRELPLHESSQNHRNSHPHAVYKRSKHAEIPVDSVYVFAKEIRARHKRKGPRVHTKQINDSVEILDWGTTDAFYKFTHYWEWNGSLLTGAATLVTPSFPVRNRANKLDISFSNDSLLIKNLQFKAGKSDFLVSGRFRNIKDGFTSDSGNVSLKANLKLVSDTIDVNEIAGALFSGDSEKDVASRSPHKAGESFQKHLHKDETHPNHSIKPFLIPVNLDAKFEFGANNVLYSDLLLNNFSGEMLLYDGAINIHEFNASSEVGTVNLNALYYAPSVKDMDFSFGLKLNDFNIRNFLKIVPAVDSMMPLMRGLGGIVSANVAASSRIDRRMNLELPSLKAAIRIEGDSLTFLDPKTFSKVAKWLLFKNKNRNIIDHVTAELTVNNGEMRVYPFIFDFDRYRLGIQGYNDLDLNFHYHVAVLKSPLPFKFGINISGKYDHLKLRFGGAKFNEKEAAMQVPIVDDIRVNLVNQIQNVFLRGVKNSDFYNLLVTPVPKTEKIDLETDVLTPSDSTYLRQEGLIP